MIHLSIRNLLTAFLLAWLTGPIALRAQTLDPAFQTTVLKTPLVPALQSGVNSLAVQPDGKILVAGGFDFVNGSLIGKLQRLNTDGTTDASFNVGGTGANGYIAAVLLQPDGKILVGGGFNTFNELALPMVVRLNANGTLDTGFTFGTASSIRQITSLAIQPDGKILVGSGASLNGAQTGGLVRLLANGTVDPSFNIGTGVSVGSGGGAGLISAILVQANGMILIGGSFVDFNGQQYYGLTRLTTSGALDSGFLTTATSGTSLSVSSLAQQVDGKLLVGGSFTQFNGQATPHIMRLLLNGTADNTFQVGAGPNNTVRSIALDPAGNILIGGYFTQVNGINWGRVARLTATGSLDAAYGDPIGANNTVNTVVLAATGQVYVGGGFTQYNTTSNRLGLAKLGAGNGQLDNTFVSLLESRGTISQAVSLPNGQLLVAGSFLQFNGVNLTGTSSSIRRVNANGTLDTSFASPTATGTIQAVQPNGSFYLANISTLIRVLASGVVDNGFSAQLFGAGTAAVRLQGVVGLANGQILVFGQFTSYGSMSGLNGVVRINSNGTPDNTGFTPASGVAGRRIIQLFLQPSSKIVLLSQDMVSTYASTLIRLNANGTLDNTFSAGVAASDSYTALMQPDGRLLLRGSLFGTGPSNSTFLKRLTVDGAVDPTFSAPSNTYYPLAVQADGRLLAFAISGTLVNDILRLNLDGTIDTSFSPVAMIQSFFAGDDILTGVVLQPTDGKILLFGSFRYVAGQVRIGLARLSNVGLATRAAAAVRPLGLYPNPARSVVTIELPVAQAARPATLLDLNGRIVRRWTVPARQASAGLPLDAVPAGLYLLQVRGEDALYQQRLVVTP